MTKPLPIIPLILFLIACGIAGNTLWGDGSLSSLRSAKDRVKYQHRKNQKLQSEVDGVRTRVAGLRSNPREIEKEIRNTMKVRGENERVFLFTE